MTTYLSTNPQDNNFLTEKCPMNVKSLGIFSSKLFKNSIETTVVT